MRPFFLFFVFQFFLSAQSSAGVFSWIPDGSRPRELPQQCSAQTLENLILTSPDAYARSQKLTNFFNTCETYHTFQGSSEITALLQLFNIEYDYLDVPYIKRVVLTMKDGAKLTGILALKPDTRPRPMIVIQCGLVCNTLNSPSVRWPLMHLFDESPFHVLIIGSSTSAEFGLTNKKVYAGGFEEGYYLAEVAEWVRSEKSNISKFVSSIHLQGMSLGGQASLYAAVYSAQKNMKEPFIKSAQSFCPVVDLKPSIDNIMRDTLTGKFMQQKIWSQLQAMVGKVPVVDRLIPSGKRPTPARMTELVAEMSLDYFGNSLSYSFSFISELFTRIVPKSTFEYWKVNQFISNAAALTTPTIIWSASDDPAVLPGENSLKLLPYANKPDSPITLINTPRGSHCAFALSHGWDIYSSLTRAFVLAHSPEFTEHYVHHSLPINAVQPSQIHLAPGQRHFSQKFLLDSGSDRISVIYTIFDANRKKCQSQNPFLVDDGKDCFINFETYFLISKIKTPALYAPDSAAMAQMLTRWANSNLHIVDRNGNRLVDSNQEPSSLTWSELD